MRVTSILLLPPRGAGVRFLARALEVTLEGGRAGRRAAVRARRSGAAVAPGGACRRRPVRIGECAALFRNAAVPAKIRVNDRYDPGRHQ